MSEIIKSIEYKSGLQTFYGETVISLQPTNTIQVRFTRGDATKEFIGEISEENRKFLSDLASQVVGLEIPAPKNIVPDSSPTWLKVETATNIYEWNFLTNQKFEYPKMLEFVTQLEKVGEIISKGEIKY